MDKTDLKVAFLDQHPFGGGKVRWLQKTYEVIVWHTTDASDLSLWGHGISEEITTVCEAGSIVINLLADALAIVCRSSPGGRISELVLAILSLQNLHPSPVWHHRLSISSACFTDRFNSDSKMRAPSLYMTV